MANWWDSSPIVKGSDSAQEPNKEQNSANWWSASPVVGRQQQTGEGSIVTSEPAPAPQQYADEEIISSVNNEIQSGIAPDKMSDLAVFKMYNATKGTRDVTKLWNSLNPVMALRGSPEENKKYYSQLQKRGWSDELINYMLPPEEKSLKQSIAQSLPQTILPTIASSGTYLATKSPEKAALAATAAEGINQIIGYGLKKNYDPASAEKTLTELSLNAGKSMAITGLSDYAGGKIMQGIGKTVVPNENAMLRSGKQASDVLESSYKKAVNTMPSGEVPLRSGDIADKRNIFQKGYDWLGEKTGIEVGLSGPVARPLPSMVTRSNNLSRLENLVEDAFGGGRISKVRDEMMPIAAKQYAKDFADDLTDGLFSALQKGDISPSDISEVIVDEISGSRAAWRKVEKGMYEAVKRRLRTAGVENIPIVDVSLARNEAKDLVNLAKRTGGVDIPTAVTSLAKSKNMKLTYSDADELNKFLNGLSRQFESSQDWNSKRIIDSIQKKIYSSMDDAANSVGGGVSRLHKAARSFSAQGHDLFDKQLIKNLDKMVDFNDASAQVVTRIFSGEDKIDSVKNILTGGLGKTSAEKIRGKETWEYLRKAYFAESMYDTMKANPDGILDPAAFFKRFNKIGQSGINKMYSANEQQAISTFFDTIRLAQPTKGKDSFSFIIKSAQAGAVGGSVLAGQESAAIASLLAPNLLARFITSRTGNALFTEGLQSLKTAGVLGGSYSGRLLSELYKNKQEYEKEVAHHSAIIKQIENTSKAVGVKLFEDRPQTTRTITE